MKKRLLSWLLVLTMVTSLIPSTLVTTALAAELPSAQATTTIRGESLKELTDEWPFNDLWDSYDVVDVTFTGQRGPGVTINVPNGKTLIFHGTGYISQGDLNQTLVMVEDGGHLVLDGVTIQNNNVGSDGAIYVKSGGLLDLGYNDRRERRAPGITGNAVNSSVRNLVVEDGARVRQNAAAQKPIGIYYKGELGAPYAIVESGRYTQVGNDLSSSTICSDNTTYKFSLNYGDIYIQRVRPKLLFLDPGARATETISGVISKGNYLFRQNYSSNNIISNLKVAVQDTFNGTHARSIVNPISADVVYYEYSSLNNTDNTQGTYAFDDVDNIMQYDVILINGAWGSLTAEGRQKLIDYLNAGGAIYFQAEDTQAGFDGVRAATNRWMRNLGATGFEAMSTPKGEGNLNAWYVNTADYAKRLTENMTANWHVEWTAPIKEGTGIEPFFMATFNDGTNHMWGASFLAGERADGAKYGRLLTVTDGNWVAPGTGSDYRYQAKIAGQFFTNLLRVTQENRVTAAAGYNPNAEVTYQATTTTTTKATNYRTPYAALQKAEENNTVSLLLNSNSTVTSVSDELLFQNATLAYEAGSPYARNTIYADTAGVYVDITKAGEVNLYSGTVTVTPKDENYVLTMNGTMDDAGTQINGGYKITSATKYQLIADDPTSPILPQNGGKASIVIPNKGESVTVDYGNGKTVTYTAKTANDKIYLGWYQVKKQTPANMTWTDADKAWHGHTFTTTLEPNVGYEINGENLTIADTDNAMTGGYTLTKRGDAVADPNDNTISWTTYSTDDGKVTVKQQHLHSGGSDRNGIAILTVQDVHADISIGAGNNTVNAKAPTIYVVGIGKRTGHADVQLWEYTTIRNTKDGVMEKPVSGWPWEKWKVSSAASGSGTESDYKQNKVTLTSDASKLDTSSETAAYTIDLRTGDKVVVFYYDWNMTTVTIKAVDANNKPIPDYTDQVVEYEIGKQTTITAPNLIGYQPVGGQNTKDITPSETNKEITFQYEKTTGNLIYKAVYVDGAGVTHNLGTFSGGTLVKGQTPNKSAKAAPTFDNYELVSATADGDATSAGDAMKFDGTNDITVTYKYQPKTKDIAVYAYVGDENGQILNLDKTSYKGITTGQSITITAPEIAGYKVKGDASKTFFITNDKNQNQDVKFFYEKDTSNDAYVLVKLVDSSNGDKVISSYQVPGVKDKAQLIKAPAAPYGYKADPNYNNEDKTVTPTGTAAPYTAEVVFKYVPHVHTVTVVLKDKLNNTNLTVTNFKDTYQVVDGESLKITAPSIYGYTMAANAEAVKELTNITQDETVTFEYEPIDKQLVTVHVKGVGPDGNTLFESRETVTHGTASKEVTVFTLPGLKLASAMVGTEDKIAEVANGKLNVSLTGVDKGGTVDVVLNYESNMANVTVKAMYNSQPLQSYTTSLEKGVQATINAPSVPGYTAKEQNKQLTPNGDTEVEFIYTKDNGNITIIVTADGTELYRKDGGTVANGSKITLTGKAAAPTIEYYTTPTAPKSVMVNGQTEVKDNLAAYQYDGVGDIIVTYEYTRKTQDVTIIKKNVDTGAKIEEQPLNGLEVGKSHTFTNVTVPGNYKAVADRNPTSYFVEDKAGQTVTFWYKNTSADQYAQVTVNLICDSKVFQSYTVTAIKGAETVIQAPTWTGYTLKSGTAASQTITPTGTNDKVEFEYTITNPKTVTVVLKDNSNTANPDAEMTAPTGYTKTYTLKEGDTLEIWAPAMEGYALRGATLNGTESANMQFVSVAYGSLNDTNTVVFRYLPVAQANFVTHTVKFMLGNQPLYSYDKMVTRGTGNVVSYPADDVKSMIPGYTYSETTYEIKGTGVNASDVKDDTNAVIIYHFKEDTAQITIKFLDKDGHPLTDGGTPVADQVLSGYRKGQKIEVSAPVLDGFALKTGEKLIQNVTLSSTESNNEISFKYETRGHSYFFLKEKLTDGTTKIIAVVNAEENQTYNPNTTGNPLDLSTYGYRFTTDADKVGNDVSPEFAANGAGSVTTSSPLGNNVYTLYYVKGTRAVEFVPVNKDALDAENLTLEEALKKTDFDTKYVIQSVTPVKPADARVGETYQAVAQSFNGWALQDDFSKLYTVENTTAPLKVYFLYAAKSTGDVTVHYHFGDKTNPGKLLNEYTIKAVVGEKVSISAPSYLPDNKYHLRNGQANPYVLEVTNNTKEVEFYYEANFVVVTAQTVVDSGTATAHETYEVIKDLTTHSGSTTLYPPEKAGYTLIGIDATGATLTNGGADKLPTQYANNKLNLANLTQDATVTYYYKTTKASEYQTALTVEYKYNGYDLAADKTINVNTGEANSIDIPAFDGYTASTYNFTDGSTVKVTGSGIGEGAATVSVTPAEKKATLTITYTRPDGSIVLPGEGDKIGDGNDIIVKPTDPNTPPTLNPDDGSVTIPKDPAGNTGTVTRPKDPTKPADGKEDIIVPGGTTIDKDGTIHLPDGGGDITPDQKIPNALPNTYVAITYDSNNGSGDVKKEIGKKGELKVAGSLFTHPTNAKFEGWNDSGLGSGTAYAKDKTVNTSITLYAKWSANYKYLATITYKPNGGTPDKDVLQNVGHDTDPNLKATLQSNTFQISGWLFGGWNEEANGTGELRQSNDTWNLSDKDAKTLYAQWYKVNADGSITVPGKDGNPNNKDTNATANGNGNVTPKLNPTRNDKGEIEVPKGGSVTLPDGSVIGMPDGGKLLPNGTVIINRPDKDGNGKTDDGTITIPGKTNPTKPDVTDKDGQPEADAKVIELVYQINNGENVPDVTVKVVKGDSVSILANPFTWTGYQFVNWMGTDDKVYAPGDNYVAGDQDLELHAQWTKQNDDGSIELPGKDGSMTTPEDNVLVTPDKPNGTVTKQPDSSVKVEGNSGTVNRPKDPDHLDQGKENIKVPDGTIVKPDGTIILPDNGGTINPGNKLPGATPTDYISVVYKANGGTGEDVIDLIKKGQTINAIKNPFTKNGETFSGWNTAENGINGTSYAEDTEITIPNNGKTITLYAQWSKATYKHSAKITYQANDGKTNAIEDTVGANDSTKFSTNLRSNPFSVSGWDFGGWNTKANGTGTLKAANDIVDVEAGKGQTWYAQWYKVGANGSITVPGDGNPNTTDDNVTANGTGLTRDPATGNISIPAGGNVVKGNETIALPNGGTLKPDGSLSINKQPNGGDQIEVKPDGSTDNADVVVLTYAANNGTNDTRKVYATKDEDIAPLAANTFSYSGHAFLYWKSGDTIFKTNGTITPTDAMTLSAVWAKVNPDGSIELPGKDGELESPKDKDNVLVTPDKPNGTLDGPKDDGSVKVKGDGATVNRPKNPDQPDQGKENIKVPEGTIVKPDGTIILPDGTVIAPDKRIPDDVTPTNYFVVTYEPGDGSGDVIRDVITKNADTTLRDEDTFTAPNGKIFDGWLDGAQTKHDAGDTLTVSASMTFTAQWKDGTPTPPAPKYSATIVFDPNTGDATATQTVTSADSTTITRNFDAYTQHFTAPAGWTFMGWSTKQVASQSSSFYADGAEETLKDGDTLNLYAILYKLDADTKVITLPGKGGQPEGGDDVTVTPGASADLTVDKGFIKAPAGSEIKQPANATPIKVIEGEVNVYPDGTVYVPEGSKVQLPDGSEIKGETTIDPDGTPDVDNTKPVQKPDGTIVLPGQNGVIGTGDDDITIAPAGPNQPAGRIDEDGNVTITNPSGADVNIPGSNPADFKVPNGTVIKPNGDMTLLYTIRYVDGSGTEIKTATVKPVQRGISETVEAATITGYTVSGEATKTAFGEVSANLADYTITFNYTKNSTGGGSSSGGGGGGGSSTVSSYTIKASAGNGGIISPSGNVSVKRGDDHTFSINPINGYRISDVIVDGKSVGAVSTYTFDSVKANHTIQVKFVKYNSIVADPEVTGVAGWLQTKEHNGYMGGYGNGLFGPNDNMTRAQVARMFYNLLLEKDVPVTVSFTDVPADAWYAEAVNTLASLGVIKGIGDGQFAPNRTITRAEFTVIAMRFANVSADVTNPFTDIATNDWYYTAVTSAVSYGWINGYSDGSFRPQATITRAEVVTIVNRMLNRTADRNFVDSNVTAQFDDVPNTYWAYYNIMEATIAHDHSIDNDGVESWGKQK